MTLDTYVDRRTACVAAQITPHRLAVWLHRQRRGQHTPHPIRCADRLVHLGDVLTAEAAARRWMRRRTRTERGG